MGIELNRIVPAAPPGAFRTFSASQPLPTHWRRAGCIEVRCEHHLSGWTTAVVPDSDEERLLIRACVGQIDGWKRGHDGNPVRTPDGLVHYRFPPGQACLRVMSHRVPLDRPAVFRHRDGDWRGGGGRVVVHSSAESWRDELAENQIRLREQRTRYGVE